MEALIDENTIALIASAGNYGYGTIDPVEELAALAASTRHRAACRRLSRRFHPAVGRAARLRHPAVRLPRGRCHVDLRRHPQVRLRLQGHVGGHVPRPCAAQQPVLLHDRLERREVLLPRYRRIPVERPAGLDVGGHDRDRTRGLPRIRPEDLRDVGCDAGRRPIPCRAPAPRPAHVPVRVHVGRARHLPRERLAAVERMADERPAVSRRHPHGRDPTADAARGRRGVDRRPRHRSGPRQGEARHAGIERCDLRRLCPAGRRPRPTSSSTP